MLALEVVDGNNSAAESYHLKMKQTCDFRIFDPKWGRGEVGVLIMVSPISDFLIPVHLS